MRDKNLRHGGVNREGDRIVIKFNDVDTRDKARITISDSQPDLLLTEQGDASEPKLIATLKPEAQKNSANSR
jgi:preprotein translocase subunit SecD